MSERLILQDTQRLGMPFARKPGLSKTYVHVDRRVFGEDIIPASTEAQKPVKEDAERIEQGKKYIQEQIRLAKENYLINNMDASIARRTYAIEFDILAYQILHKHRGFLGYEEVKAELADYTFFSLRTSLGERYHTGLSSYTAEIEDNEIIAEGMNEPMLAVFKRGRDFRAANGSTPRDQIRESAEIVGFEKTQSVLVGDNAPVGTLMLSVSLPGQATYLKDNDSGEVTKKPSIYSHNFYDIFQLCESANGSRYIEVRRYSSALDGNTALERIRKLDPSYGVEAEEQGIVIDDSYLLAHPIRITPEVMKTADSLHAFLLKDHDALSKKAFEEIIRAATPALLSYIDWLANNPMEVDTLKYAYNAILNFADKEHNKKRRPIESISSVKINSSPDIDYDEARKYEPMDKRKIFLLGSSPVEKIDTGCGESGGYTVRNQSFFSPYGITPNGPYSVAQFGSSFSMIEFRQSNICSVCGSSAGDNHYHCPTELQDTKGSKGCGKRYSDETNGPRTKKCSCGFEFAC